MSDHELRAIRARALERQQRLSIYIRRCALLGSAQATELLDVLSRILAQLRGVASNLNQASHRANVLLCADSIDRAALEHEQREIVGALAEVRNFVAETRAALRAMTGRNHQSTARAPGPAPDPAQE